ncbi:MAG: hypothetical protein IJZ46_02365 [Bacilli bacterium]|nr:hypothetical protein [Bacilli bacterium]
MIIINLIRIVKSVEVDNQNDDFLGADFYQINKLKKEELFSIAVIELKNRL